MPVTLFAGWRPIRNLWCELEAKRRQDVAQSFAQCRQFGVSTEHRGDMDVAADESPWQECHPAKRAGRQMTPASMPDAAFARAPPTGVGRRVEEF